MQGCAGEGRTCIRFVVISAGGVAGGEEEVAQDVQTRIEASQQRS